MHVCILYSQEYRILTEEGRAAFGANKLESRVVVQLLHWNQYPGGSRRKHTRNKRNSAHVETCLTHAGRDNTLTVN